jgi:hypothetical protein
MVAQAGRHVRTHPGAVVSLTPRATPAASHASPPDRQADLPGAAVLAPDRPIRPLVMEALRRLDDPLELERLAPLTALRAVQERAARHYRDGWCATGRALRDVLRAAIEPVADVLPPQTAEMLRAIAEGGTAAQAARRCGVKPAALRKRATPQIEAALVRYLEHLEGSSLARAP